MGVPLISDEVFADYGVRRAGRGGRGAHGLRSR